MVTQRYSSIQNNIFSVRELFYFRQRHLVIFTQNGPLFRIDSISPKVTEAAPYKSLHWIIQSEKISLSAYLYPSLLIIKLTDIFCWQTIIIQMLLDDWQCTCTISVLPQESWANFWHLLDVTFQLLCWSEADISDEISFEKKYILTVLVVVNRYTLNDYYNGH